MGKFVCNFISSSMYLVLLALIPLVAGSQYPPPPPLGAGTGNDEYNPVDPSYNTNEEVYKAADKDDCHPVERLVYEEKCIAVIDEFEERECFDVTELMCSLAESIQYEMVDETYTVQRCTGVTDRVCDTVYVLAQSTKDDF